MSLIKNSLKIKVFQYLIIFSSVILILLWLFQVIFLNTYYEFTKTKELESAISKISHNYDDNDFINTIDQMTYDKGICVEIIDQNNNIIYTTDAMNRGCITSDQKFGSVNLYKKDFINSGETKTSFKITNPRFNNETLVYGAKIKDNVYAFINTSLVPIDSTIMILKNQLIIVSAVVLVLSIVIAYFISKKISKPIITLNESAKKLAKQEYDVVFTTDNDYDEINELRDTLNYTRDELSKNDELRRDLMANVSHDLKTPLTMIKAYAEMVRDLTYKNKTKRNDNLNTIITEADRLNILVNDILSLSKLESNIETLKIEKFDLVELVKTIVEHYKIFSLTEDYKFIINMHETVIISADKKKIEQVVYNLINNAINYTGKDKKVFINIFDFSKKVRLEVVDTGNGIDQDDLNKIWDKYYKTDKNHRRHTVGTGLGLAIVKNILRVHKYKYGVESVKGKGTVFYFEIQKEKDD